MELDSALASLATRRGDVRCPQKSGSQTQKFWCPIFGTLGFRVFPGKAGFVWGHCLGVFVENVLESSMVLFGELLP